MVRRLASALLLVALALPAPLLLSGCSSGPETEEQARVKEIDDEIASIQKQLANPSIDEDKATQLRDRQIELNAERNNVMREATKKKERGE